METQLQKEIESHPYPLMFATLCGAHLFGFPSSESDYDLRGVHLLPTRELLGLMPVSETVERCYQRDGLELDLMTHDLRKFCQLLLSHNGDAFEQLYSPLVLFTTDQHQELKQIARDCLSRSLADHYLAAARMRWELLSSEQPPRVRTVLNLFRALLTGLHLMREGEIQAELTALHEPFKLPYLPDLIAVKLSSGPSATVDHAELPRYEADYQRLCERLAWEREHSLLPAEPANREELNAFLIRVRLNRLG